MWEVINRKVRFLSLDPGSRTLGLAVLEYDLDEHILRVLYTTCLNVDEGLRHLRYMEELIGTRLTRLYLIETFLTNQLKEWEPSLIIMETPYMGSHAQAYKVLVEVMRTIERCCEAYSAGVVLAKIDPSTVKKTVGVPGNSGDKTLMLRALKMIPYLRLEEGIDPDVITEHEVDAILIGNYYCVAEMSQVH